jgi:hypothetical protein
MDNKLNTLEGNEKVQFDKDFGRCLDGIQR